MPFRPTLVALREDADGYPYLGFHVTEIALMEPGNKNENAGVPQSVGVESRDKISEGVTGEDTKIDRRKLAFMEMLIDFVHDDVKAEIERMQVDGRTVYFCPNMGPDTVWSFPLVNSLSDFTGNKVLVNDRSFAAYWWDESDRVIRSVSTNETIFPFRGAWNRYLLTQSGMANEAEFPVPDSLMFSIASGALVSSGVSSDFPTPILENRGTSDDKVYFASKAAGGTVSLATDSNTGMGTTNDICAAITCAWSGLASFLLYDIAVSSLVDSVTGVQGDGKMQIIRLAGANPGASQYRLVVTLQDYAIAQTLMVGSVFFGESDHVSGSADAKCLDWAKPTTSDSDDVKDDGSSTPAPRIGDATISFFFKWTGTVAGILQIGDSPYLRVWKISNDTIAVYDSAGLSKSFASISLADGEWGHFALVLSDTISLYVNGDLHPSSGSAFGPLDYGDELYVGCESGGVHHLDGSGLSHMRMDRGAWTEEDVQNHYDTYFNSAGRGVVEPLFGRKLLIEDLVWKGTFASGGTQWRASAILQELGPAEGLVAMNRQEDMD